MKKRSLLRTILCSILLFGTIVPCVAVEQATVLSGIEETATAKPKGSTYSRFADWLRDRTKATRSDIRHLWRWGSKKARGQQVSERESAAAKRIAKKIGISLAVIAGFFLFKSQYDRIKYKKAFDRVANIKRTEPGLGGIRGAYYMERINTVIANNDLSGLKEILYVVTHLNPGNPIGPTFYYALAKAVGSGKLDMIQEVLRWKGYGWTWDHFTDITHPLFAIPEANKVQILELLLKHGANPDVVGGEHEFYLSPLYHAVAADEKDVARVLLKHGASADLPTREVDPKTHNFKTIKDFIREKAQDDVEWNDILQEI